MELRIDIKQSSHVALRRSSEYVVPEQSACCRQKVTRINIVVGGTTKNIDADHEANMARKFNRGLSSWFLQKWEPRLSR
jgi:hypothetical protein